MISLAAITLCGSAVYVGLQLYDKILGVKQESQHNVPQHTQVSGAETDSQGNVHKNIFLSKKYHIAGIDLDRTTAIVTLTATTGIIHIALARPLMVLNGIGSIALLIPHYFVPRIDTYHNHTRDILIAYTTVTLVGFYIVKDIASWLTPIGIVCKLVELGLLALLWDERTDHIYLMDKSTETVPPTEYMQPTLESATPAVV